jgi:hypothetical protein
MSASGTLERHDGTEVAVEPVKQLPGGGARIEIDVHGGATWRLDVTHNGTYDVVTCYDEHGQLADIEVPRWVEDDVLVRLR